MDKKLLKGNEHSLLKSPFSGGLNGFARAMDFQVILPQWGDYEKLMEGNVSTLNTYIHEWVHYFQLIATNAGHALIDLHRTKFEIQWKYLIYLALHHGWDFSSPAAEWKFKDDSSSTQSATLIHKALVIINHIFRDNFSYFSTIGYSPTIISRIPKIEITSDLKTPIAAISVDEWHGTVSLIQVLEHAAATAEAMSGNGFAFNRFFNPGMADYYFGYWYLHQNKIIKIQPLNSKKRVKVSHFSYDNVPEAVFFHMFLFTQIALNVSELISVEDNRSSETWRKIVDPGGFFPRVIVMSRLVGAIFCDLLINFQECSKIVKKEYDSSKSWLKAASAVCKFKGYPLYETALSAGIYRMERYLEKMNKETLENDSLNVWSFFRNTAEKCMLRGLRNLIEHDITNVAPYIDPGHIPFPKIMCFKENGERRLIGLKLPTMKKIPSVIDVPKAVLSYLLEQDRVNEGLLFEQNITCYPPLKDDKLAMAYCVWPCEKFIACRESWRNGYQNFCSNDGWKQRCDIKETWGYIINRSN